MAISSAIWILLFFVEVSVQFGDPLNDFCRRFGHQTTVIDQKLYIDGGLLNWNPMTQYPQNYSNSWLLYNDLTTSPTGIDMPQLNASLSKNATIPDVSGGVLWPDSVNKRFYLYGGDYYNIAPQSPNLLSYDIIYNQWEYFGSPNVPISSVSWAGSVGISELGQGYALGGWLSNASVPGWTGGRQATSALIKYDYAANSWTNTSGPNTIPKAEGVMLYVPASNNGLLIYFGGVTAPYGNDTTVPLNMSTIYVYDIQSSRWYTQTANGGIPLPRAKFCAGVAWAPDKSSYNIYMYGGYGFGANATGFDDLYILSLPTFTWIPWWESSGGVPHHSLTCNVVGGQMLIVGGTFPLTTDCDAPVQWGTHNVDLGKVSGHMWNVYSKNITTYVVPPEVISVVGGSSLGGAKVTAPPGGFDPGARDLSVFFTEAAAVASRSPTRAIPDPTGSSSPSKLLGTGAIAGIAVGGAVVLIALFLGCCCFIRRHRSRNLPGELPADTYYTQVPPNPSSPPFSPPLQSPQVHYQLAAPIPVELSTNNYNDRDPTIKSPMSAQIYNYQDDPRKNSLLASPHSTYSHPLSRTNTHELSVTNTPISRYGVEYGGGGGMGVDVEGSPTPTNASLSPRREARKPVPQRQQQQNQTFYSA